NDGCYRPLHVIVPPHNLLNADVDRPVVGGNHETSQRAVDAIFRALASALPDRVTASGPATSGVLIFGARTPDGRWAIFYETHGGGEGAGVARDGASAIRVYMSNVMNTPTEVVEAEYPLRVEEHALRPGSAGDGRQRGGLGFRRAYRVTAPEVTLTSMLDRRAVPPRGVRGGRGGPAARTTLHPGTPPRPGAAGGPGSRRRKARAPRARRCGRRHRRGRRAARRRAHARGARWPHRHPGQRRRRHRPRRDAGVGDQDRGLGPRAHGERQG